MRDIGKTSDQACVGILMLETDFPRILGDIGNGQTWSFPVRYKMVNGATARKIVGGDPIDMVDAFIDAGKELIGLGCSGITTSCGFLALIQDQVKQALGVPVATSSLMQVPMLDQILPKGKRVGVLTISAKTLTKAHLIAAGANPTTPIVGTDNGRCFSQAILSNAKDLNYQDCRLDLLDAAKELTTSYDDIGAIVFECTNMAPYALDIRRATGLPVFSIYSFINWFQAGLMPTAFPQE